MKKQEQNEDRNKNYWIALACVGMVILSCAALWGGYYFYQYTQGTWMEIPEIVTAFILFAIGPFIFIGTVSALLHE